jgi:hypothetical protein
LATPEEAAKLAPVGNDATTYNKQISDLLGKKAGDFPVRPTDSLEHAKDVLSAARAESEAEGRKTTEARGAEAQTREQRTSDAKPVIATDPKTHQKIVTSMGDAIKNNLEDVIEAPSGAYTNAQNAVTNVDLMDQALRTFHENVHDIDAITQKDKNILMEFLNSREMNPAGGALNYISGSIGQYANAFLQSEKAQTLTDPAKNILQQVSNMRESSMGLGKLETGGSRMMQSAVDAINRTLPGTFITNAADADKQLKMFADRLEEIKRNATIPKGATFRESPFNTPAPKAGGTATAAPEKEPARPASVPEGYKWNAKGPKGAGWYK